MTERAILGWSGGIDSTYNLWYLITKTEHVVQAHHVLLALNKNQRWRAELKACERIKDYIKQNVSKERLKDVIFTKSTYRSQFTTVDQDIVMFTLAQMALVSDQDCFAVYSITKDDVERAMEERGYYPWVGSKIFKIATRNGDFVWGNKFHKHKIEPQVRFMLKHLYKKEIIKNLPKDLLELTWSCREPIKSEEEFVECGKCRACIEKQETLSS